MARFDLFVIGGGSGGIACARRAAAYGARVGLAEPGRLGGTCVVRGCVPKKLMHYAAHLGALIGTSRAYGWRVAEPEHDFRALLEARNAEIRRLEGIYERMLETAGVTLFRARARLASTGTPPHRVEVGGEEVLADNLLIAVGGRPSLPEVPGIEHAVTSEFLLEEVYDRPPHLAVVGAGYIGLELASIMRGLGSRVTLIYRRELPLRGFDYDLRVALADALAHEGIELRPCTRVERIRRKGDGVVLETDTGPVEAGLVLYATGREPVPNTRGLGLEDAGVRMDADGTIYVDVTYRSNVPGIYAVGDCSDHAGHGLAATQYDLTPVAIAEGRAVAERLFRDHPQLVNYETVPTAVFSVPQAASVGYSEQQARDLGHEVAVYTTRFRPMLHSLEGGQQQTFMKILVDRADDRVLGCHMVGEDAAEIIQGFAVALTCGATKEQFDSTVGLHPSAAEEFVTMYQPAAPTAEPVSGKAS
ncbi:MAG TPA: glutathione-disulfide reductase [Rhodospirillales bacterium]|nr:glutathione-disulfide reductase [Rhodospirillales bacterium]